jgi:hypothetical protein
MNLSADTSRSGFGFAAVSFARFLFKLEAHQPDGLSSVGGTDAAS